MRRRLCNFAAAAVSLALCAAIIATCLATRKRAAYLDRDLGYYRGPGEQVLQGLDQAYWQGGTILLHSRRIDWAYSGKEGLAEFHADHPPRATWHVGAHGPSTAIAGLQGTSWPNRLGFYAGRCDVGFSVTTEHHRLLAFPAWSIVLPLAAFAALSLRKNWWFHRRRCAAGSCVHCGYDLRATPDRCPECGAKPKATEKAST